MDEDVFELDEEPEPYLEDEEEAGAAAADEEDGFMDDPEQESDRRTEPAIEAAVGAEDELGSFSMTAGERIGYSAASESPASPDE